MQLYKTMICTVLIQWWQCSVHFGYIKNQSTLKNQHYTFLL